VRRALLSLSSAVLAFFVVLSPASAEEVSWATRRAQDLTDQGKSHRAGGRVELATARFLEALQLDGTYEPAYLELAQLREAVGDAAEAERTYSLGIAHVPGFLAAYEGRARVRRRAGRVHDALEDLEEAARLAPSDPGILEGLVTAYIEAKALPAALAVSRRLCGLARASGEPDRVRAAEVRERALRTLVGELDPVAAGRDGRGPVRWALSRGVDR
jgi:tetratricopeptide (TPR) repeat protein